MSERGTRGIHVGGAKKRFGAVVALDGVDLTIAPGERVALVGTNGSGKTTLLRALAGLVRIDGKVTIDGVDVAIEPEKALAHVAYVPQIAPPLEASVGDVVRVFVGLRGRTFDDVAATAKQFGLELSALKKTRMRDLSGGMKQKLLAAMALAAKAKILLCDEPTANLDVGARAAFVEAVRQMPKETTLVLCSHRVDEVSVLVGRIVELRDGKVVRDDVRELREPRAFEGDELHEPPPRAARTATPLQLLDPEVA